MANEITAALSFGVVNGQFVFPTLSTGTNKFDQTSIGGGGPGVLDIGTTEEVVTLTDIATPGFIFIKNLDATNYVQVGPESASAMIEWHRYQPGWWSWGPLDPGAVIRAKANTAVCKVHFVVFSA